LFGKENLPCDFQFSSEEFVSFYLFLSLSLSTYTCCSWSHGLRPKKNIKLLWWCHQLLSAFLAKGYLPQVPRQSHLSANNKGDTEIIPGAVHRSPGSYLTPEENPGKPHL
jgi:hypothetical protein